MKISELHNAGIYYKENWVILWNNETGRIYWRNTWTGQEKDLGIAKDKKKAQEIRNTYLQVNS